MPFEKYARTVFEYNLEFVNSKPHWMQPHHSKKANDDELLPAQSTDVRSSSFQINKYDEEATQTSGSISALTAALWNRLWDRQKRHISDVSNDDANEKTMFFVGNSADKFDTGHTDEILNSLGDSWESCRPCYDLEMVQMFCSSDIGKLILLFVFDF